MTRRDPLPPRHPRPEGGYALLMAVFLAATMFMLASVAAPTIINNGRRQREQELIWRGNQYMRGVRLYFQKNGRFPQNKEELIKGTLSVHFVRKAFSDPVGAQNADWRFIYVAPSGQLTGSVRYHTLQEMAAALGGNTQNANLAALFGGGAAAGAGNAGAIGALGGPGAGRGAGAGAGVGARGGAAPGAAAGAGAQGLGGPQAAGSQPTPIPLAAVDGPVLGASLIGFASKVKSNSLLSYQGKENYFEWEFIWNPLMNRGPGGAQQNGVTGVGTPANGAAPGAGNFPGAGTGPGTTDPGAGTGNFPPIGNPGVGAQRGRGGIPAPTMPGFGR